ncbi:hypothetical protein N1030_06085 [Desulfovibrio mangrovi]|uniref:hypothetical protein n=1 Tax=Desulfovibrio mangrovi TaxID=2976983 RepID=UPI00224525A8|nr:hypothetical protein [Desulfovibrio mangrovi]UZP68538.1 hypothetical protein N1030_06085 [Desulfovibrio mangrovi]
MVDPRDVNYVLDYLISGTRNATTPGGKKSYKFSIADLAEDLDYADDEAANILQHINASTKLWPADFETAGKKLAIPNSALDDLKKLRG